MELGGLEPPTSWVRCAEVGADADGLLAIIHDSGTPGDECLNATRERRRTPRPAGARQPPVMRCNNHRMPRQDLVGLIIAGLALATSG
jgi:hypothetical protein